MNLWQNGIVRQLVLHMIPVWLGLVVGCTETQPHTVVVIEVEDGILNEVSDMELVVCNAAGVQRYKNEKAISTAPKVDFNPTPAPAK